MAIGKIEERLNEIAVRILTADEDPSALETDLRSLSSDLAGLPQHQRMLTAIQQLQARQKNLSAADFIAELEALISTCQKYIAAPQTAAFPHESTPSSCVSEMRNDVDPQFLTEFIEKHLSLLEEFEGSLMERIAQKSEDPSLVVSEAGDDFTRSVKSYLHNLKGDAGSIGLIGMERVCHTVEDMLVSTNASLLLEPLLELKEWAVGCLKVFATNGCPLESSEAFMTRFQQLCGECLGSTSSAPTQATPADSQDLPSDANLELLAELMGDTAGESSSSAAAPSETVAAASVEPGSYTIEGEPDLFNEFVAEAEDHLAAIETTLLDFGDNMTKEGIDTIFRAAHSIKGASSYFKLDEVRESSHKTEDLLDEVRTGKRPFDQGLMEILLAYKDLQQTLFGIAREAIKRDNIIQRIPASKNFLEKLNVYKSGQTGAKTGSNAVTLPVATVVNETSAPANVPSASKSASSSEAPKPAAAENSDKLDVKTFVKVDTRRLDQLIDSIGEMVIYSSMLIQSCRAQLAGNENIIKTTHQVEKFSRDLQSIGMSMRLVPIRGLFQKMSRLVWDTSKKIGKDIKFEMEGEDTELDRTIIDQLADPLMHMVRNALDHGVEPPEEREKKGKMRQGNVKLAAYHSGGSIHIKITDDGRGLDPQKLLAKAREKAIIAADQQLSLQETYKLIFAAGFSTAAVVTDISGRGVGMDVVRRNIESLRGHIHIESEVGKGTVFTIELPLTLAIIDGILVNVGNERFIVPTLSVVELIRPKTEMITSTLDRAETFHFRGKFLPIFRLSELFSLPDCCLNPAEGILVIVESNGEHVALMVDNVLGSYSTVIKNLSDTFEDREGLAGCAIMANGDVALILDPRSLLMVARREYSHLCRSQDDSTQLQPSGA